MFGAVLLSLVTLLHLYVFLRLRTVPFLKQRIGAKRLAVSGLALWALFAAGRFYGHDTPGVPAMLLELAGMVWMATLFLVAVALFATDLLTVFGLLLPAAAPRLRGVAVLLGLLLSAGALVQGTRPPVVTSYDVEVDGLPTALDGLVIVGLSDLHLGSLRGERWLRKRVSQVRAERPDVVALLGDLFEGHGTPAGELASGLSALHAPLGVWAVLGNHEFHGRDDGIAELFRAAGIRLLRNERVEVRPGLVLAGVDDLTSNHRSGSKEDLIARAFAAPRSRAATVLLSHTPWSADRAARSGAGLMLSGHTHGGQLWPFGYLVRSFYPLLAGRYDVDGMTVIVSRGTGLWGPPMRLWAPGEIIRVTLRPKQRRTLR
jgi:predicted MPP superfamily phosphohydrolase